MKRVLLFFLVAMLCPCSFARPNVLHYISTHKALLVSDGFMFLSAGANAAASVHCQKTGLCTETSPFLTKHPTNLSTYGLAFGFAGFKVTLDHTWWWLTDAPQDHYKRWLSWGTTGAFTVYNGVITWDAVHIANEQTEARRAFEARNR